jgi:HD-like signal output (HDOD) protein
MPTATYNRDIVMKDLPPISPLAMTLVGKLARSEVDFSEVERIIEKDTVLCAEVLRTVNSARFSRGQRVTGISQAVMLLGSNRLRRIALATTVAHMFGRGKTGPHWSQLRFNLHSAAVGVLAEILSSELPVQHPEAAFVAGLLHDVGKFAIDVNLRRESEKVFALWCMRGAGGPGGLQTYECEREILGFDHAEISGLMMERWNMSSHVQWAVSYHHHPDDDVTHSNAAPNGRKTVNLSRVLELADRFVLSLGMTSGPMPADLGEPFPMELPGFELSHEKIAARFVAEYDEFREFLK